MSQHRKHRGYATQRLLAQYLRDNGWAYAESTGAGRAGSDITGVPFDIEVKARTGFQPAALMKQLDERKSEKLAFGVLRLNGQGEANIDNWVAMLRLEDLIELLRRIHFPMQSMREMDNKSESM